MRQMLPDLLRDEWHKRVNQAQRTVQNVSQYRLGLGFGRRIIAVQRELRELDVPVAQIIPNEVIQEPAGLAVLVRVN
ncbi:hypothetical protein D3C81_1629850 [compost metagenome]